MLVCGSRDTPMSDEEIKLIHSYLIDEWKINDGVKGNKGDVGPPGAKGAKGDTGLAGPKGEQGPAGVKGERGPRGERGLQGPKGESSFDDDKFYELLIYLMPSNVLAPIRKKHFYGI